MRADVITADDGYYGIYLDGELAVWTDEHVWSTLEEVLDGKTVTAFLVHPLGDYGCQAVQHEDPADLFDDIPSLWFTDALYSESYDDDE